MMSKQKFVKRLSTGVEYSDLHWFRGWGERLDALVNRRDDDGTWWTPGRCDWMCFRPDDLARNAMITYGATYPVVISQVQEYLDHAEWAFADFLRILPPVDCPNCGSDTDFDDEDGFRHCGACRTSTELAKHKENDVVEAYARMEESLPNLARVILKAADAIEAAEESKRIPVPDTDKKTKKFPWKAKAEDAAKAFKALRDDGAAVNLDDFCEEHAGDYDYKPSTLKKVLYDHRERWDPQRKYGGRRKRA